ncbi:MAG: LysM peptidoglycan-binding domain-containing protein [Polyangiaceae bacterium]
MSTFRRRRSFCRSALAPAATLALLAFPAAAFAQDQGPGAPAAVPAGAPGAPTNAYAAAAAVSMGNPQSANGTIGGGNATESSAHPVTGDQEDSFDYGRGAAGGGAAHGDANGPIFVQGTGGPAMTLGGEVPSSYLVRKGDTLWAIGDHFFQNPYLWPRLWSYNPQIKNPHWINPGDELRLKEGGDAMAGPGTGAGTGAGAGRPMPTDGASQSIVDRRRQVPSDTVFLRDQGWVHDSSDQVWGDISGAPRDKMFLSDLDEVYVAMRPGHDVKLGQELTIFRPQKTSASGDIVQILGTARVDQYDPHDRIARARIVETLDVIERGADVGPLERRFQIVPPKRNEAEVQAHVLASVHPHEFYGQNSVVFIDKGDAAGLKPGNRLFVVRRGDAWRHSLVTAGAGYRVSPDDERPMPPMEKTPGPKRDETLYPDEIVGELRVLSVRKDSAVCLVTQSNQEIEIHDVAVARKGY